MQRIGSVPFELPQNLKHWVTLSESETLDLLGFSLASFGQQITNRSLTRGYESFDRTIDEISDRTPILSLIEMIAKKEGKLLEMQPGYLVGTLSHRLRNLWLSDLTNINPRITTDNAIISESKQKILILIKLMCGRKIVGDDIRYEQFDLTPLVEYIRILKRLENTHNGTEQKYKKPTNVDEMRTQLIELLNSIN
jgi:hypothetical protein